MSARMIRPITNLEKVELNCQRLREIIYRRVPVKDEADMLIEQSLSALLEEIKTLKRRLDNE